LPGTSTQHAARRPGALRKRSVAAWIVLLLAVTLGCGYVVGVASAAGSTWFANITHSGEFEWTNAAVTAAAVATALLAGFTGALAWTTNGLARAQYEDLAARNRPQVIVDGVSREAGRDPALTAHVRNVGVGPALDVKLTMSYTGELGLEEGVTSATLAVLEPGADASQTFTWRLGDEDAAGVDPPAGDFRCSGDFTDHALQQRFDVVDMTSH
jgi:hypothetical protein